MADKVIPLSEVSDHVRSGMTIGVGGWGSRRKPMALIRQILRSDVDDLTVVAFGGPEVGLLCAAGKVRRVIYGFVSLDSIALDPNFRAAREAGSIECTEYDEGMFVTALRAGASRMSFLPTRAGMGSDVLKINPELRTVDSPYTDETYVAVPGIRLDLGLIHLNRGDSRGNGQYLGPDPYFDDLIAMASDRCIMSVEKVVSTEELTASAPPQSLLVSRMFVSSVVEAPNGAHFTSCEPDYPRDEKLQKHYATSAADADSWKSFESQFLAVDEDGYQDAVRTFSSSDDKGKETA
ncbi:CoA transferase subunit A [Rhodococcus sovatensis]|uniref:CoA-transferase n=1 Tax=Rhodococcus sovatensis TaxID=1805840 RepID=A0ABZ2PHP5_9NOCA